MKEMPLVEAPAVTAYRARFEAGRQFEDDLEFCPNHLLDFDDVTISVTATSLQSEELVCDKHEN
jgi:Domain of unknown function (DUF4452)